MTNVTMFKSAASEKGRCYAVKTRDHSYIGRIIDKTKESFCIDAVFAHVDEFGERTVGYGEFSLDLSETAMSVEVPSAIYERLLDAYKNAYEEVMLLRPQKDIRPFRREIGL